MGQPKGLLSGPHGPLVRGAVSALLDGGCSPVGAVIGAAADQVSTLLPEEVHELHNPAWRQGMSTSVRQALEWSERVGADGVVILPVDTPGLGAAVVRRVREHGSGGAGVRVVQATFEGRPRNTVLIGASYFEEVSAATVGDSGARVWLEANRDLVEGVECSDIGDPNDLDTPDQLERWRRNASQAY